MHILWITLFSFLFSSSSWETDFSQAKKRAETEHKMILLNFSGSDWCGPCIRLREEIFEKDTFKQFAAGHLVLVNADFPRLRKHQLSKEQQAANDQLAEVYNKKGIFPLTLLLSADGTVVKTWEGNPNLSADAFISQVKSSIDASH
jgi:thioredoxin-related protein